MPLCLPRRIGGRWALIHRPVTTLGAHMWISYSPDLRHWGSHKVMLEARRGGWWDANKIGLCSPPIETAKGWLAIYHGVRQTASGSIYRLGLALFDLERPEICLQRGDSWMFGPEEPYERGGDVKDVVFPCGQTIGADGDTIHLYYGAADFNSGTGYGKHTMLALVARGTFNSERRNRYFSVRTGNAGGTRDMSETNWLRPSWAPWLPLIMAKMPELQFRQIQSGGIAACR